MSRVVVIGIDGADFQLIEPWAQAGYLPTLARLMQQGVASPLRSTLRPESSVAWTTFATGTNPGKHGIFGFVGVETGTYQYRINNARHTHGRRFWQIAGAAGKRVLVVNVPMTYPPEPVNGALVAGMLTPSLESDFTYPPELKAALRTAIPGYVIDVDKMGLADHDYIQQLIQSVQARGQALQYLAGARDWDLLVAVFTETDRLQHFFWADRDTTHPLRSQRAHPHPEAILQVYREIDTALQQLLGSLESDVSVLLVSDHGFNGCARRFYVNAWLQQVGFLTLTETIPVTGRLASWISHLRRIPWLRTLKRYVPGLRHQALTRTLQQQTLLHLIDWKNTQAFFSDEGAIRINLRGREPEGIVSLGADYETLRSVLIEQLLALRDPLTEHPVIAAVYRREALYTGPYVVDAPDLIIEPQREHANAAHNFILASHAPSWSDSTILDSSFPYTANHTLTGIFIAHAPDKIPPGRHVEAHIEDIAPTVLAMLGVPISEKLDGRVLEELFAPGILQVRLSAHETGTDARQNSVFTASEEEKIRSRLQDLGYLG